LGHIIPVIPDSQTFLKGYATAELKSRED